MVTSIGFMVSLLAPLDDKFKKEIIEVLNLEEIVPDDIGNEDPLFGEGLGLDSIDALELIVLLEKNYGLKIENAEDGQRIFYSIKTIADYITEKT